MIVKLLVQVLVTLVEALLSLLPDIPVPDIASQVASLEALWEWMAWANVYFPLDQCFIMAGVLLTGWAAMHVVHLAVWLGSKVHVFGGGSS